MHDSSPGLITLTPSEEKLLVFTAYTLNGKPGTEPRIYTEVFLTHDGWSSSISSSLSATPIQSSIKSRKPDGQLEIPKQAQNKPQRKVLLTKIKVQEKPMPGISHHLFLTASSTCLSGAPVATSDSKLVTRECFIYPSNLIIQQTRSTDPELHIIPCSELLGSIFLSLLHDIHNVNKKTENERADAREEMEAFKHQD